MHPVPEAKEVSATEAHALCHAPVRRATSLTPGNRDLGFFGLFTFLRNGKTKGMKNNGVVDVVAEFVRVLKWKRMRSRIW